jgi:hypothetical protein
MWRVIRKKLDPVRRKIEAREKALAQTSFEHGEAG